MSRHEIVRENNLPNDRFDEVGSVSTGDGWFAMNLWDNGTRMGEVPTNCSQDIQPFHSSLVCVICSFKYLQLESVQFIIISAFHYKQNSHTFYLYGLPTFFCEFLIYENSVEARQPTEWLMWCVVMNKCNRPLCYSLRRRAGCLSADGNGKYTNGK